MKKRLYTGLTVLGLSAVVITGTTFAQMSQGDGRRPVLRDDTEITSEQFPDMKSRVLSMIEERRKRLEDEKACVEAATNMSELKKCRPQQPRSQGGASQGGMDQRPQQSRQGETR